MENIYIILCIIFFGIGFAIAFYARGRMVIEKVKAAEAEALRILEVARQEKETLLKEAQIEAKDTLFKIKSEFEAETKDTRAELKKNERRLIQKEENIDR
ncbi:Rnase Y domain-containing protein, partial [Thermodesulfobacteriota bacterium]